MRVGGRILGVIGNGLLICFSISKFTISIESFASFNMLVLSFLIYAFILSYTDIIILYIICSISFL